jgi:hypothetical protein
MSVALSDRAAHAHPQLARTASYSLIDLFSLAAASVIDAPSQEACTGARRPHLSTRLDYPCRGPERNGPKHIGASKVGAVLQ